MTFGPRLATGAPVVVPVAVADSFFQTILGSCWSVSALASTSSVLTPGVFGSAVPGTSPTVQEIAPREIEAPSPATRVNVVPSTGGTVTVPPSAGAAPKFLTRRKNGYVAPGLTQPRWGTKEVSGTGPLGASTTWAWLAVAPAVAARLGSVAVAGSVCRPTTSV